LEINKEQTLLRREKIQQLRSEIQTLKERLTSYRKWRGQRVGLDEMLVIELMPIIWDTGPQINQYIDKKIIDYFAQHVNSRSKLIQARCTKSQISEIIAKHTEMTSSADYNLRHNRVNASQEERVSWLNEVQKLKHEVLMTENIANHPLKSYLQGVPNQSASLAHWLKSMIHNVEMEFQSDIHQFAFHDAYRTANFYDDADTQSSYRRTYNDGSDVVRYGSALDDDDDDDYDYQPNQNNVSNDNSPDEYDQHNYVTSDEDDPNYFRTVYSDNEEEVTTVSKNSPTQPSTTVKKHQQVGTIKEPTEQEGDVE
jgi:polyhydroxyalkanoate synthesis regulator phasin